MLFAQMKTLDALQQAAVARIHNIKAGYGSSGEGGDVYMRHALRAQRQCRSTAEAIALIRNPTQVAFVKQANIGGAVQVNNGVPGQPFDRAREIYSEQDQLSGDTRELLPNARTPGNASPNDPPLEALGKVDRANVRRR
jgi:uncharacterized protein YoaH (UPF0181 family)